LKIFRYTEFKSNPFGHGAEKRTAQIGEILSDSGVDYEIIKSIDSKKVSTLFLFKKFLAHFITIGNVFNPIIFKNIRVFFKFIFNSVKAEELFAYKFKKGNKLLLWEYTRSNFFYIPGAARGMDLKTIAFPHNIESLVPNQGSAISGKKAPDWFKEEIKYLSLCDLVFCISKEDTNLLNLFGINAYYLPYYPVHEAENALLRIREKRTKRIEENKKLKLLMLGSADNQPTRLGMNDRIKTINKRNLDNIELIIAGFKTELLNKETDINSKVSFLGTISNEQLEMLLSEVDLILIHQPATTGALTKIPEMLIAGIPVLANFSGARNYYNIDGLILYENDTAFYGILKNFKKLIPALPEKPINEYRFFIDEVNLLNA
jgi:hypothetical protein